MAAEVTAALDGAVVDIRLRGRDPEVVVVRRRSTTSGRRARTTRRRSTTTASIARISLRLPDALKVAGRGGPRPPAGAVPEHLAGPGGRPPRCASPRPSPSARPRPPPLHRLRPQLSRPAPTTPEESRQSIRHRTSPSSPRPAAADRGPQRRRLGHRAGRRGRRGPRGRVEPLDEAAEQLLDRVDIDVRAPSQTSARPPGCGSRCRNAGCSARRPPSPSAITTPRRRCAERHVASADAELSGRLGALELSRRPARDLTVDTATDARLRTRERDDPDRHRGRARSSPPRHRATSTSGGRGPSSPAAHRLRRRHRRGPAGTI